MAQPPAPFSSSTPSRWRRHLRVCMPASRIQPAGALSDRWRGRAALATTLTHNLDGPQDQHPRPVAHLGRLDRTRGAREYDRPGTTGRRARLSPLLGGRAPRDTDARRAQSRGPDRCHRLGHDPAAGRKRRSDAPPLQPAEGGRDVQRAQRSLSGPDRSRHRQGARHRPADDVRPPARPPRAFARRLPRATGRAARVPRNGFPAGIRSPGSRRFPGFRRPPRCGSSGRRSRARSGPPISACRTRSPISSTLSGPRRRALYRERFTPSERISRSRRLRWPSRWSAPRSDEEAETPRRQRSHGDHAASSRAAHPRPAGRAGAALPRRTRSAERWHPKSGAPCRLSGDRPG